MKKALFLDRDGVINIDHGYVYQVDKFEFNHGIFQLCQAAQQAGYLIIVVTNQSGIGRGYYTEQDFWRLTDWMVAEFRQRQIDIKQVYFCPHHPTKAQAEYLCQCQCRKPMPGMLLAAICDHQIAVQQSIMVGDKNSDMQAAVAANIKHKLFLSEKATSDLADHTGHDHQSLIDYCQQQKLFN